MKCIFCDKETDYYTTDQEPICEDCAKDKGLISCPGCGEFYNPELSNGGYEHCGRDKCHT